MDFVTQWNGLFKHQEDPGGGSSQTETAGYVDTEKRINEMIMAGQRLTESYVGYDFQGVEPFEGPHDDLVMAARQPGLDPVDVQAIQEARTAMLQTQEGNTIPEVVEPRTEALNDVSGASTGTSEAPKGA